MVWCQQRLKILERFKKLINDWEEYDNNISSLMSACKILDEDLGLLKNYMGDEICTGGPFSHIQLQDGLCALQEDFCGLFAQFLSAKHFFADIEKKSRFLIAEVERTGDFSSKY
jgi:hypothetical protein